MRLRQFYDKPREASYRKREPRPVLTSPSSDTATMPPPRRRFLLVANPEAGRLGRRMLEPTLDCLAQAGAVVTRAPSTGIKEAARAIALASRGGDVDAVLVAGGDGSFRMAATALLGSGLPIGLIPLGTGNVLAHELGLPTTPDALARLFIDGPTAAIRCARSNGAPFFLMAGAGFDGAVIAHLHQGLKQTLGKAAYAPAILRAVSAPLPRLHVTVDGQPRDATWIIVSNARFYGGRFVLVPHTHALDEGWHAVLLQARDRLTLMQQLLDLARGSLLRRPDVRMLPCRRVSVHGDRPVAVEIDGDAEGTTPLEIETGDEAVRVIVPAPRRS